jgi:hypothetical protein
MHREKPHKLLQVGVTPTPATSLRLKRSESEAAAPKLEERRRTFSFTSEGYGSASQFDFREVIRLPDCKSGVVKRSWK